MTDTPERDPRMPLGYVKAAPPTPPRDPVTGYPVMVYLIPGPSQALMAAEAEAKAFPAAVAQPPTPPPASPPVKPTKKK